MKKNIEKYLEGKLSNSKQKELLGWIREDNNQEDFKEIKKEWWHQNKNQKFQDLNAVRLQNTIQEKNLISRKSRLLNIYRYAAVALLLISFGISALYLNSIFSELHPQFTEITTENGQISSMLLPDSTKVWINSGTKLVYNNQYGIKNREIKVLGEAYFSVTKNKKLPLIVDAGQIKVKVTGTKFNVSNYQNQENIEVVLEEGSVDVLSVTDKLVAQLVPSEMISLSTVHNTLNKKNVNARLYTSWKEGILNLYEMPLSVIAQKLEKRYNQEIEVDNKIATLPFTFTVEDQTLDEVLVMLEKISPVKAITNKDKIKLIYKPKKK